MGKLRVVANVLFIFIFVNLLLFSIPTISLTSSLSDGEKLKSWLDEGNFYENLTSNLSRIVSVESEENENSKTLAEAISENGFFELDDVDSALSNSIDPDALQVEVEKLIDDTYSFLRGEKDNLEINFSLAMVTQNFESEFRTLFDKTLSSVPVCDQTEILSGDFDPISSNCIPNGTNLDAEVDKYLKEATSEDGIFGLTITTDDLEINDDDLEGFQLVYSTIANVGFSATLTLLIFFGLAMVTAKPRYKTMKIIGLSAAIIGGVLLIVFGLGRNFNSEIDQLEGGSDLTADQMDAIGDVLEPVVDEFVADLTSIGVTMSSVSLALGLGLYFYGRNLANQDKLHKDMPAINEHKENTQVIADNQNHETGEKIRSKEIDIDSEPIKPRKRNKTTKPPHSN